MHAASLCSPHSLVKNRSAQYQGTPSAPTRDASHSQRKIESQCLRKMSLERRDNKPSAREGASDPMSEGATLDRAYRPHQLPCCPCKDDDPLQGEYMGERQAKLDPSGINPATNALPPLSAWSLGPTTCGSSTLPTQIRFSQHIL